MRRAALTVVVVVVSGLGACKPRGVKSTEALCAKATDMYAKCEKQADMHPQEWELILDRWRGLCRAVITGETKQLLPDALQMYQEMSDEVRAGLKVQAECTSKATTCDEYRACEK